MFATLTAAEKRVRLRAGLKAGRLLQFPGAFSPLAALEIQRSGFDGVYASGAVISADLGLPDIGLTTLCEVAGRAEQIARVTDLPTLVDADTGFGEPMNAARTVRLLEERGLAGCHLEDQVNPKRCGHLDNKTLIPTREMVRRIRAAVDARRDGNFLICARTDARGVEGLDAAIERARAYAGAGADMIFPEGLADAAEFSAFRRALAIPLLANMTEFGKTELLSAETLERIGVELVIYPVTLLRLAMRAASDGLEALKRDGGQAKLLPRMQHRSELYDLLRYADYAAFDETIFNFQIEPAGDLGHDR